MIARLILTFCLALFASGCRVTIPLGHHATPQPSAPYGVTVLPALPAFPDTGQRIDQATVAATIPQYAPYADAGSALDDSVYTPIPLAYLREAAPILVRMAEAAGYDFTTESGDCDNWSDLAVAIINLAVARAGIEAEGLAFRFNVLQAAEFGLVPAGGTHAPAAFWTDHGLYILEPQTGNRPTSLVPWEDYPNRDSIILRVL